MKTRLAAAVAVGLTGVLAPSAMGATLISDRECYREGERASFLGSGFPPGQQVAVTLDGQQLRTAEPVLADAVGNVSGAIPTLPAIPRSERKRTLTITQVANPALTTSKVFRETKLYVVTKPSRFRPGRRLRVRAGGFYGAGKRLFAHVRGPRKRNIRIGGVKGPCGKVSPTKRRLLKKGDRPGRYRIQFDTVRQFRGRRSKLRLVRGYFIRRIFRFSRGSSSSAPVLPRTDLWEPTA